MAALSLDLDLLRCFDRLRSLLASAESSGSVYVVDVILDVSLMLSLDEPADVRCCCCLKAASSELSKLVRSRRLDERKKLELGLGERFECGRDDFGGLSDGLSKLDDDDAASSSARMLSCTRRSILCAVLGDITVRLGDVTVCLGDVTVRFGDALSLITYFDSAKSASGSELVVTA